MPIEIDEELILVRSFPMRRHRRFGKMSVIAQCGVSPMTEIGENEVTRV
jgi:hypothetical protein